MPVTVRKLLKIAEENSLNYSQLLEASILDCLNIKKER